MPTSELRPAIDPANNLPTFEGRPLHHPDEPVFDQGLAFDVETLVNRREALKVFGNYSMYSQAAANENYLRGVGETDAQGVVAFQSIFPACYSGRWPHIHFEVYPSLAAATKPGNVIATSQVALPPEICGTVYATTGYESSVQTFSQVSLATDNVFRDDGGVRELGTISGSVSSGLTVDLPVPVQGA